MMELARMVANGLDAEFIHGEGEHAQVSVVLGASLRVPGLTGSSGVADLCF
jgi:pyruvate ferredoxin oxidoreductase alpha subunit/oxalate oxidoreductase subunit alpha